MPPHTGPSLGAGAAAAGRCRPRMGGGGAARRACLKAHPPCMQCHLADQLEEQIRRTRLLAAPKQWGALEQQPPGEALTACRLQAMPGQSLRTSISPLPGLLT
jgi:hypothetical protein